MVGRIRRRLARPTVVLRTLGPDLRRRFKQQGLALGKPAAVRQTESEVVAGDSRAPVPLAVDLEQDAERVAELGFSRGAISLTAQEAAIFEQGVSEDRMAVVRRPAQSIDRLNEDPAGLLRSSSSLIAISLWSLAIAAAARG